MWLLIKSRLFKEVTCFCPVHYSTVPYHTLMCLTLFPLAQLSVLPYGSTPYAVQGYPTRTTKTMKV